MTPEEFEPIGHFMGYAKQVDAWGETHWWSDNHDGTAKYIGLATTKTSLTPAECYEALERLVDKGYLYRQHNRVDGTYALGIISKAEYLENSEAYFEDMAIFHFGPTIHEAIEAAILALLKAEGGKE